MRIVFCALILSWFAAGQDLPDGGGKQIFMSKCGQCHGLKLKKVPDIDLKILEEKKSLIVF